MISKQRFMTMTVTMLVLLFIFQFPQVMKEYGNNYDINEYAVDATQNAYKGFTTLSETGGVEMRRYTVFIGRARGDIGKTVDEWCAYAKRHLVVRPKLSECPDHIEEATELILLEGDQVTEENDLEVLLRMAENGTPLVFCSLPEPSVIAASERWRRLLGIQQVVEERVELEGVNLFAGFLLGGQEIYVPKDEEERKERQDLELSVPWYLTNNSCKTYMVGMLDDPDIENEELPALIWRSAVGDGKVFAINNSLMSDCTGIGILDAVMAELEPYYVYPVVNAQNLSVANFPGLSSENGVKMGRLYSRDQLAVYRDILWPGLCATIDKSGAHITCFIAPQSDYGDTQLPEEEQLIFYLKEMREKGAEAGISLDYVSAAGFVEKLEADEAFFESIDSRYRYGAVYLPDDYSWGLFGLKRYSMLRRIQTAVRGFSKDWPIVSYGTRDITLQSRTSTGISHTYSDDLRMKSLQTALGYSNIVLDMNRVTWPDEEDDRWEILAEKFSSNINTYWRAFGMFAKTSISESDSRIRTFLGLDYECSRDEDGIHVTVQNREGEAWFILRTHGEEIDSVEGGDFEKIETDAYLVRADEDRLDIRCRKTNRLRYYLP